MLLLTRKDGESITIGDDITVTVVRSSDGQVRPGIAAPRELAVHHQEVADKISAQKDQHPQHTAGSMRALGAKPF